MVACSFSYKNPRGLFLHDTLQIGGPFCGCPCNESSTVWGSTLLRLIFGKSQIDRYIIFQADLIGALKQMRTSGAPNMDPKYKDPSYQDPKMGPPHF